MSENFEAVTDVIGHLLHSEAAAMLDDRMYEDLEKFCADARNAAEGGDFEEAHRLLSLAREFLVEEDSVSGPE